MTLDYGYGPCGLGSYYWENKQLAMFVPDHGRTKDRKRGRPGQPDKTI